MKTKNVFSQPINFLLSLLLIFISAKSFSQTAKTDSLVKEILDSEISSAPGSDAGLSLMKSNNFSGATQYYTEAINKNSSDASAYFNRGVAQFAMNEPAQACRDWSSLLALGDTAGFKLLDAKCHGTMVVENDTLKKEQYHKMFAVPKPKNPTQASSAPSFLVVEQMPEFPGGSTALMNFISKNIHYPTAAREKKIQGTVIVNFTISSKGTILFPYIQKGIGYGCDEEALRVIKSMPAWSPGKQSGKTVLVRYKLPVMFSLN